MQVRAVPAFDDNYIWLAGDPADGVVVVDPGCIEPLLPALADGLRVRGVLLTHHHADHIGAAAALIERSGAPCFAPDDPRIELDCVRVADGDPVTVASMRFSVLDVPGHTRSHLAFVGHRLLFCGDTLFSLGCGRLFEGTPAQMLDSLERLAALADETRVCCGHEYTVANARFALAVDPHNADLRSAAMHAQQQRARRQPTLPSTIAIERRCNPFLRCAQPALVAAAARHLGRRPDGRVETFATLREMKDRFA